MRSAIIYLNDGTNYTTDCNGTDEEITKYFLGTWFNFGTVGDLMKQCVKVEVE